MTLILYNAAYTDNNTSKTDVPVVLLVGWVGYGWMEVLGICTSPSQMYVAPWCNKVDWMGLGIYGMDFWVEWSIEHLDIAVNIVVNIQGGGREERSTLPPLISDTLASYGANHVSLGVASFLPSSRSIFWPVKERGAGIKGNTVLIYILAIKGNT